MDMLELLQLRNSPESLSNGTVLEIRKSLAQRGFGQDKPTSPLQVSLLKGVDNFFTNAPGSAVIKTLNFGSVGTQGTLCALSPTPLDSMPSARGAPLCCGDGPPAPCRRSPSESPQSPPRGKHAVAALRAEVEGATTMHWEPFFSSEVQGVALESLRQKTVSSPFSRLPQSPMIWKLETGRHAVEPVSTPLGHACQWNFSARYHR